MIKQPLPTLVAIDASSSICSLALQVNGEVHSTVIDESKHQGVKLIPALEGLLDANNITLDDIDGFVLSNGPGRFTGLRIAVGFIQGLAYSTHKKIITINSLELLAQQFVITNKLSKDKIWICNKAYNNVYYTAIFSVDKATGMVKSTEQVFAKQEQDLLQELKNADLSQFEFVGAGWQEIANRLEVDSIKLIHEILPHASYIFNLANRKFADQDFVDLYQALPEYAVNPYEHH